MTWKLTLRHLSRHWRLNLVLLTIMVLGASLLASLPILAITMAGESLTKSLESAPVHVRNISIQGKLKTDELPEDIELSLGNLLKEIIAVREGDLIGFSIIYKSDGTQLNLYPATLVLKLSSFDRLDERVRVVEGRLPEQVSWIGKESPIFESAIGTEAAGRLGLGLGDEVSPAGSNYKLRIVGIVEPLHPDAEIWWGDRQMLPFSAWQRVSFSPDIEEWHVSLFVHPQTMISKIYHNQYWRIILDYEKITTMNASSVRESLVRLQSILSEDEMVVRTGLIDLITQFEDALATAQISLILLTFQSLFAVFYLLGMFGSFMVKQSRMELATLSARGFSQGQITGLFARATSLLALLAGFVSPLIARWSLALWSDWQGQPAPTLIPEESWWLALFTVLFSWIFLVISVYRYTRKDIFSGQGRIMRYHESALTQRHIIWDIFFLTLGGLAYWQLTQGSTITNEINNIGGESAMGIADLVLLLGPSLLLLAAGLITIRLLPLLWRFLAQISRQGQGLTWNLVFTRLARQPVEPSQITLLICLTVGLTFFASVFIYSLGNWQRNMARYIIGADIRIHQSLTDPDKVTNQLKSPGINNMTQVFRAKTTFLVDENQRLDFDLLAVDPKTFPSVVSFPPGVSSFSVEQIMGILESESPSALPVIISSNANTRHLNIGDQITLELGEGTYPSEVVGIIINFPLLDDSFAITDLSLFTQQVDMEILTLTDQASRELWLAVEPSEHETVIAKLVEDGLSASIVGNSQAQLEILKNILFYREVSTAFELNAMILIPLSVVGFTLIQLLSIQRRRFEFNVLQAMGLSKSKLRSLLLREGFIFVTLGILIGFGIGIGLTTMMQPLLLQILPPLRGDFVLNQVLINWPDVGIRFIILIGFYGIGLIVFMIGNFHNQKSVQF